MMTHGNRMRQIYSIRRIQHRFNGPQWKQMDKVRFGSLLIIEPHLSARIEGSGVENMSCSRTEFLTMCSTLTALFEIGCSDESGVFDRGIYVPVP